MKKKKIILGILLLIAIASVYPAKVLAKYIITKHKEITIYVNTFYDSESKESKSDVSDNEVNNTTNLVNELNKEI